MVSRNKSYFEQTAQEMYELCLNRAGQTKEEKGGKEAVALLKFADALFQDYSVIDSVAWQDSLYRTVYQQYYDELLEKTTITVEAGRLIEGLDLAISLSEEYRQNQTYIVEDAAQMAELSKALYRNLLNEGERELSDGNYRAAVDDFRLTNNIPESYYPPTSYENQRKQRGIVLAYLGLSQEAQKELKWREAFGFLVRAEPYTTDEYQEKFDSQRDTLIPNYAKVLLKKAEGQLSEKEISKAKEARTDLKKLQTRYGWSPDKDAKKRLRKIDKSLD